MPLCEPFRRQLPQYVADGEPAEAAYVGLREHLRACPSCRAFAARLRLVEEGLRSYAPVSFAPDMTERVMRAIASENRAPYEEWHLLPWDIWVPALAFLLAMVIALMSIPTELLSAGASPTWDTVIVHLPSFLSTWLGSWRIEAGQFWAIWIGIFATTAGLGISMCLANWTPQHSQGLDRLEMRVTDLAARLWGHGRHAH